jgi:CheY-like chemotaxis protein
VVAEALEVTAPRWRDEAERRGVVITITQHLDALPPVEGNAFELRDALVQIILNAVTAMPQGGTLAIRGVAEESGWVTLEVGDSGVGMSEDVRRRVADRSLGPGPTDDAGRGLVEVTDIIERHGGSLGIESTPGQGTIIRLRLHASRFQIIPPSERPAEPVEGDRAVHILLVDDDQRLLTVLSDMLLGEGHAVTTATTGEEALALFDPAAHDVVITDLGMPKMNGWEVAERVKTRSPSTGVFLLTGWGEGVVASDASRFVDQVIAKPISADALLGELAGLRRRQASGG